MMLVLTPEGLSRKTMSDILGCQYSKDDTKEVQIGTYSYKPLVMESDYDDGYQITGKEGDLIFHDFVTYGYGENVPVEEFTKREKDLEDWGKEVCEKHHCKMKVEVTANYW